MKQGATVKNSEAHSFDHGFEVFVRTSVSSRKGSRTEIESSRYHQSASNFAARLFHDEKSQTTNLTHQPGINRYTNNEDFRVRNNFANDFVEG